MQLREIFEILGEKNINGWYCLAFVLESVNKSFSFATRNNVCQFKNSLKVYWNEKDFL